MNTRLTQIALCSAAAIIAGCTRESVHVAFEAQHRADQIQRSVFDQQHASLRLLLYRDLAGRLEQVAGNAVLLDDETRTALVAQQRAALNDAWNDRDLFEFWATQYERAAALRIAAVDTKLAADQSVLDLMWKQWSAKRDRTIAGLAANAGAQLEPAPPADSAPATEDSGAAP